MRTPQAQSVTKIHIFWGEDLLTSCGTRGWFPLSSASQTGGRGGGGYIVLEVSFARGMHSNWSTFTMQNWHKYKRRKPPVCGQMEFCHIAFQPPVWLLYFLGQTLFLVGILMDIMVGNGEIWCKLSALVMVYTYWRTPTNHLARVFNPPLPISFEHPLFYWGLSFSMVVLRCKRSWFWRINSSLK